MSIKDLINAYQPETHEAIFGEDESLKVVFIASTVDLSRKKALELFNLLENSLKFKAVDNGVDESGKPKKGLDFDFDITKVLANLNSESAKSIEQFIIKNSKMYLNVDGEWRQADTAVKAEVDYVFTVHPDQYYNFLFEGIKFHFAKHLPSGNGLLKNLANKVQNSMTLGSLKANSK